MYGMLDKQSIEVAVSENTCIIQYFFCDLTDHKRPSIPFPFASNPQKYFGWILEKCSLTEILHV